MVTSSPIALALGLEWATSDIMDQPPRPIDRSIWTREFILDTFFYGILMGIQCLSAFFLTISTTKPGSSVVNIPEGCNVGGVQECDYVYISRSTAFYSHCLLLLLHGLNCRHSRHSMLSSRLPPNKYLWYAIILGLIMVLPTAYLGQASQDIFTQSPFGWQWAIVAVNLLFFAVASELYKVVKRSLA